MSSPVRRAPPTNTTRRLPHQTQTRTRAHGSGTATPEGSATQTVTSAPPVPEGLTLRLRGQHEAGSHEGGISTGTSTRRRRQIQWAEDVIDNEGLGRKRSKVCCIYHKNREVGESSSEDDSSSEDSDGSDSPGDDDGSARPVGGGGRGRKGRRGEKRHEHGDDCGHGHGHGGGGEGDGAKRKPSPNAYEKMPRYDVKPLERQPGK